MKQKNIIFRFLMIGLMSGLLIACGSETDNDDNGEDDNNNQVPEISGTPSNAVNEGNPYHFAPTAFDGDSNDSLIFSITNKPSWASFNNQTGVLNGTPGLDDAADYGDIIIGVSDGTATAELSAFMISVLNTNQIPVISGTPANTVNEGSAYHFAPMASDGDSNDSLTFSITNKPSWAVFNNQTGVLNGTPGLDDAADYGNIIISVSDGNASAELSAFMISVLNTNQIPVISGTPANTVDEGSAYHFAPTATDGDSSDNLTFSISNKPSWASFNNQTGVLDGTPDFNDADDYSNIIISVSDGRDTAQLPAFTISVIDINQSLSVTLSWLSPVTREDETILAISEISGYRIYYGTDPNNLNILTVITDNSVTHHTTAPLDANTYYFAVTTYDIDGTESTLSNIESKTLP